MRKPFAAVAFCLIPILPTGPGVAVVPGALRTGVIRVAVNSVNCSCTAWIDSSVQTDDACITAEVALLGVSEAGVCDKPGCNDPKPCKMGSIKTRYKLTGGQCTCTQFDVSHSGADAGAGGVVGHTGTGWTAWFTTGGFELPCSDSQSSVDSGGILVTCTAGGNPVPRTAKDVDFEYECTACTDPI